MYIIYHGWYRPNTQWIKNALIISSNYTDSKTEANAILIATNTENITTDTGAMTSIDSLIEKIRKHNS